MTHGPELMKRASSAVPDRMRLTQPRTVAPRPMRAMTAPELMAAVRATQ